VDWQSLERFAFGDSPALADKLAALVLDGSKRATCWAAVDGPLTEVGKRMVMLDGAGRPRAVVETVGLVKKRFHEVDTAFAWEEGEGNRSLEAWRDAHRRFFTRKGQFAENMLLYCERFRVIALIDATGQVDASAGDDAPGLP
jgi:uncharacterized protein YhfF